MKDDQAPMSVHASVRDQTTTSAESARVQRHSIFQAAWYLVNSLLVVATLLAIYSTSWEYSTRRYLKGFSDAIIPAAAPAEEKIEAILTWMAHGPARQTASPSALASNRDPTDTLNVEALLRVCGTATNAFINLANVGGLPTRRLLLLNSHQMTKHVVAEVLVDERWIVADPAFRVIFRRAGGQPLTREELLDTQLLAEATRNIPMYDPNYTFDQTAHVRIARLHSWALQSK